MKKSALSKKVLGIGISAIMLTTSCITHAYASDLSNVSGYSSNSGLQIPQYDSSWGYNFPSTIGKDVKTTPIKDVLAIEYRATDRYNPNERKGFEYVVPQFFWESILAIDNVSADFSDGGFRSNDVYRKIMDRDVYAVLDNTGRTVPKNRDGWPDLSIDYLKGIKVGDVVYTVLFKKDSKIAQSFQLKSELSWQKVKSTVIQPDLTGKITHAFSSGVSNTEAYSFARTIGSSKGISISSQLKAGPNSSNGGFLQANYTQTMSQSVTNTFSRSTTITSQENTTVDYTYANVSDHPVEIAIYRPVEVFTVEQISPSPTLTQINNSLSSKYSKGELKATLPDSYTYNHSDYVSLKSN